jgi:hypothetical protein
MTTRTNQASLAARRVLPLHSHGQRLRCDVARWALAQGHVANLDALTLIIFGRSQVAAATWSTADISTFLLIDAPETCRSHHVELPSATSESLWTYLSFLDARDELRGSTIGPLHSELTRCAGLNRVGRLRHPAGGGPRLGGVVHRLANRHHG